MRRLQFWKRETAPEQKPVETPVIAKFGISPRTDIGVQDLPDDPDTAARASALAKRRDALLQELRIAEEAEQPDNQWRRQIALVTEALGSIERDRDAVADVHGPAGHVLPRTPISDIDVSLDPVATVRFSIGETGFKYAEELDWAERGTQIARSDLIREQGEIERLVPIDFPAEQREALIEHLEGSLFTFATDVRDRVIENQPLPGATLADLARPSEELGGWLDWSGQSPIAQARQLELHRLRAEQERLANERTQLLDEESKAMESIPVVRRRLADVEHQLSTLMGSS
jgi:hypothetical protein